MKIWSGLLCAALVPAGALAARAAEVSLPLGTPLVASIPDHLPLRVGQAIDAQLVYPVYVDNMVVLKAGTHLRGSITGLEPDRSKRIESRLRGDFTPFATPVVQFDHLLLPDGRLVEVQTSPAMAGAPIFRLVAPPPRKGGFVRQQIGMVRQMAKDRIAVVTGPDKRDRLVQFLYSQIPYHPQRIAKGTAWTVETTAPVVLGRSEDAEGDVAGSAAGEAKGAGAQGSSAQGEGAPGGGAPGGEPSGPPTWIVNAFLSEGLNSASTKEGQAIHATVAEPILNPDKSVAVPQGSVLDGAVTQVRPARRFGRAGVLRFDFRTITLPSGEAQSVQASLAGIDSAGGGNLAMDSEGKVQPKPQDKVLVPLILIALAARPLDRDGHDGQFGKNAVASNALGLVGFIAGTAAHAPNFAAGIGYYGAAVSLYNRWIKRGAEISFQKDTRIVVQTTARRSSVLRPGR